MNITYIMLAFFVYMGVLSFTTSDDEKIMKECVVAIATAHPDWKAEELHIACRK